MQLAKKHSLEMVKVDMTPFSDMVFQLIAFFMILLNFTEADQDQRIHLPSSELAMPPDHPPQEPRTIQLMDDGNVVFAGQTVPVGPQLERLLRTESQILERTAEKSPATVTVIIRADAEAKSGEVQKIIELCQKTGFEKFALRARQSGTQQN